MREVGAVAARKSEGHDQGVGPQRMPTLECLQGVRCGLDMVSGDTKSFDIICVVFGHEEHDPQGAGGTVIWHGFTLSAGTHDTVRRGCRKRGS
jgi:hypothetical protein